MPEPLTSHRLATGGLVDRARPLGFTFDGRRYRGFAGDTLASALVANGVRLLGRSFKYHRPRGLLSAGPEEPNALVELRTGARREPNSRATMIELHEGLEAASQNRWPSLAFDLMAANSLVSPLIGAGFYYKTFMWPASLWERLYEPLIRRAAGLGRAAEAEDPDHYEKAFAFCDLLVVGSGPAGLMAALAAGRAGARVILAEEDFALGGRLLAERRTIGEEDAQAWRRGVLAELESLPDVRLMPRTTVFGTYDGGVFGAVERVSDHLAEPPPFEPRQRSWRITAKRAIVAAGSIERPLVFGNNDRPGVMLAGAVRTYLNRFGAAPGRSAVVFATGDEAGARTLADLQAAGLAVAALVDPRPAEDSADLRAAAEAAGVRFVSGVVREAEGGRRGVEGVAVAAASGERIEIACDLLALSGGWSPTLHLTSHHGHRPVWDEAKAAFLPSPMLPQGMAVAGAAAGAFTLAEALTSGARAGAAAADDLGLKGSALMPNVPETDPESTRQRPLWRVRGTRKKAFIDFQNDVTAGDVELAEREGFRAVEHLKRYTTLGMATDQGKTANVNGLALMAELTERSIAETGTTVFRPPTTPVAIGALAGHHRGRDFRPTRLTPAHGFAAEKGAVFVEAGAWLRPQFFPRSGEGDWLATVNREVATVRSAVGLCDVSTLGKIDVQGADALALLERVYANNLASLKVGRARYGLMLREDGFVFDDGTIARLGESHFLLSTTTANAVRAMQHLDYVRQLICPTLDVRMVSVTEQWAQFAIAGPRSRAVLQAVLDPGFDLSNEAFPYLAAGLVTVGGGIGARLFRLSYSGELAYELAVPARFGEAAARALTAAVEAAGGCLYGTEALGVMRIEKGHVAGNELNGQTTACDLGLGGLVSTKKDFVGRELARRPALLDPERPTLVGLTPVDPARRLKAGAHILPLGAPASAEHDQGYVTSVAFSPTLGHSIALALVARGPERIGERVRAADPLRGEEIEAVIASPHFVDPAGERLRG